MSIRLRMFLQSFSGDGAGSDIVHDQVYSSRNFNSSPLTISGLEGDTYDYEFIVMTSNVSGDSILDMTLNSDTGTNYRNYEMKGLSSTASVAAGDSDTAIELQNFFGTANPNMLKMQIIGSSGDERYINSSYSADAARLEQSSYWKNTASELTSVTITAASSVTADAHVVLIRYPKADTRGTWEFVEKVTFASRDLLASADPIEFSVDGNTAKQFKIEFDSTFTSVANTIVRFNNDTGTNYKQQMLRNFAGSSISAVNYASNPYIKTQHAGVSSTDERFSMIVNSESGVERLVAHIESNINVPTQHAVSSWWTNTASNLTVISIETLNSESATGTATLYKKVEPDETGDTITFAEIETVDITGIDFSAGHTFSSLTGNSSTLFKLEWLGDTAANLRMQINGDTGSNYVDQYLQGSGASATAATATTTYFLMKSGTDASEQSEFEFYIHPKSGNNRPGLNYQSNDEDTVRFGAKTWLNSVDQITSIKVFASTTATTTGTLRLSRMI